MAFFDQLYGRLFQKQSNDAPVVFEPLTRSDKFLKNYEEWKSSGKGDKLKATILRSYQLKTAGLSNNPEVHILNGTSANGIALTFDSSLNRLDLPFLMEYLKDFILLENYRLVNADRHIKVKSDQVETVEKYYLKPIILSSKPYNQLYGNLLIEFVNINNRPSYIKWLASCYHDSNYQPAIPFTELFEKLTNTNL